MSVVRLKTSGIFTQTSKIAEMGRSIDRIESDAVVGMLRGLLRTTSASEVVEILHTTLRRLGGTVVPVEVATEEALPLDVSLGEGPPLLVEVEHLSVARAQIERLLPRMVEDARQAVNLLRRTDRLQDETMRDSLTGLGNRRILERVLSRSTTGSVVLIDLDHFKQVNDQFGHAVGDDILRAFGATLDAEVRAGDTTCRIGGEEFAIVLSKLDPPQAMALVERIRTAWEATAPLPVTFSAGVAGVNSEGGTAALMEADRAMYRAKEIGRDRTVTATAVSMGKQGELTTLASSSTAKETRGFFVAFSEIRVASVKSLDLVAAFKTRLGEVELWPGFERLEVWLDERDDCRFVMVSWWADKASFSSYMRSDSHKRSHDRILRDADGPNPVSFSRFRVVAQ